jgi:cyclopropane fatty-acyl-phospholipid synthase-like methyltransferase
VHHHSPSSERNKVVIGAELKRVFADCKTVLEIGSGSGQHALHFAEQLPNIVWQPADLDPYYAGLVLNLTPRPDNILPAIKLNLSQNYWIGDASYDGMFSANCLHIMSWSDVEAFFVRAANQLISGGILCVYGPFRYNGEFTSASNQQFQHWLKMRDQVSGIRDFEAVEQQAALNGFTLLEDVPMPANNQLLIWSKQR